MAPRTAKSGPFDAAVAVAVAVAVEVGVAVGVEVAVEVEVAVAGLPPLAHRHAPVPHLRDALDPGDELLLPVGRHHHRGAGAEHRADVREEGLPRARVEPLAPLVQHEQFRRGRERASQEHAATLAARELEHGAREEVLDAEQRGDLADPGRLRRGRRFRREHRVREAGPDHRLDREVPVVADVRVLGLGRDEGEPLARADGALRGPVRAVEEPSTRARGVGPELAAEHPEQRGLAGAARPDDGEPLARPHLERHVLEERRPGEADVDAIEGDERAAHPRDSTRRRPRAPRRSGSWAAGS